MLLALHSNTGLPPVKADGAALSMRRVAVTVLAPNSAVCAWSASKDGSLCWAWRLLWQPLLGSHQGVVVWRLG